MISSALAVAVGASAAPPPAETAAVATIQRAAVDPARLAAAIFAETNRVRKEHRRRALRALPGLATAAEEQAAYMALVLRATHTNVRAEAADAVARVERAGLLPRVVAENVATLTRDGKNEEQLAAALVAAWMQSPGHRANLLNDQMTHLGCAARFARLASGSEAVFSVQVFFKSARLLDEL